MRKDYVKVLRGCNDLVVQKEAQQEIGYAG
jgi:hypothetical protein